MKIVFFGTSEFAVPILDAIHQHHEVVMVITQPDAVSGRGNKLSPTPVKRRALEFGLDIAYDPSEVLIVNELDAYVVASYGKILKQSILDHVPIALNVHPSMLPQYRGATPLQSAIRDGLVATGVTIIAMDAGMDTGDILLSEPLLIGKDETYGSLHDRAAQEGAWLIVQALDLHEKGLLHRIPQSAIQFPPSTTKILTKQDWIIPSDTAPKKALQIIRSLAPNPLARVEINGEMVKVAQAEVATDDKGLIWNGIKLLKVIPPNKKIMDGTVYLQSLRTMIR